MFRGSIGCWLGPTHMSCFHILNRACSGHVCKAKWVGLTKLHFRDIQSDHSIAMADVKRDSLTYYLCHWEVMDTVLKKTNKKKTICSERPWPLGWVSVSTSLPLHPCTTRGCTAQGPGTTFTMTSRSFIPSFLVSSIRLVRSHVEGAY